MTKGQDVYLQQQQICKVSNLHRTKLLARNACIHLRKTAISFFLVLIPVANCYAKLAYLENGKQTIRVNYSYQLNPSELRQTQLWLKEVTASLLTVYGEWPKDNFEIEVRPTSRGKGPVPWGQVDRGDPDKVSLFINPAYGFNAVVSDWTAYHELSHLLIPYRGYGDLWISEGLASYYQNIIQARSGKLSEHKFWRKLVDGFERGRKQTNWSNIKLSKVSENMRRYRNHMRVHWSGVLFWLTADVRLRENSKNSSSLDSALKQLKDCCANREMSALDIVRKLDQLTNENIFTGLFYEFRNSYAMPEYIPLIRKMGVERSSTRSRFSFNKNAPFRYLRKSIFVGDAKLTD